MSSEATKMFWAKKKERFRERGSDFPFLIISIENHIYENLAHLKEWEYIWMKENGSTPALILLKTCSIVELVPLVIRILCPWHFLAQAVILWISLCCTTGWDVKYPSFCLSQRLVPTPPCAPKSADCFCFVGLCLPLAPDSYHLPEFIQYRNWLSKMLPLQ